MTDNSYISWRSMSDEAFGRLIGSFIKQERLRQNKTQEELSLAAGISRSTLSLLERGEKIMLSTLIQVMRVLDLLHLLDIFKIETVISPLTLAKEQQQQRYRARNTKNKKDNYKSDW